MDNPTTLTEKELEDIEEAAFYESGLSAHGCLENLDGYARESIQRYGRLMIKFLQQRDKESSETPPVDGVPKKLIAYTDGSGSAETCGYGVVMLYHDNDGNLQILDNKFGNLGKQASRQIAGEIEGAIVTIKYCLENGVKLLTIVHDYTGIGCWSRGEWQAKDPDAKRLQEWNTYAYDCGLDITYTWTKGHSKNKWNDYADELADKGVACEVISEKIPDPFFLYAE